MMPLHKYILIISQTLEQNCLHIQKLLCSTIPCDIKVLKPCKNIIYLIPDYPTGWRPLLLYTLTYPFGTHEFSPCSYANVLLLLIMIRFYRIILLIILNCFRIGQFSLCGPDSWSDHINGQVRPMCALDPVVRAVLCALLGVSA